MADRPDIKDVFGMPEFRQLPGVEKINFLNEYPEFQQLPLKEKSAFIQQGLHQTPMQPKGFWKRAGETLWGDISAIPSTLLSSPASVLTLPVEFAQPSYLPGLAEKGKTTGKGILAASQEQAEKAKQSETMAHELWKQKRYGEAIGAGIETGGRQLAAGLPVMGPMAATAAEELTGGDPGAGAVHTAELLGPEALKLAPGLRVGPLLRPSRMTPEVQRALQSFEKAGGQLSEGQRLGSIRLQKVERALHNFPGSERQATEFFINQQEELGRQGRGLVARTGAATGDVEGVGAGEAVQKRLTQRIKDAKGFADRSYESMRRQLARAKQTLQTGTQQVPGSKPLATLTPAGMPRTVPVMSVFEAPVELQPMRQALKGMYDDLVRLMPEGRRAHSPAFRALEDLMKSGQPYMNAEDFDRSLSAIKALAREGDNPFLTTQSQRVAMKVIGEGEKRLSDALRKVSPNLETQLNRARKAVHSYHETAEFLADLGQEPVGVFKTLSARKDGNWKLLTQIYQQAPRAVQSVGRTYLEGLLDTATKEGGFKRAEGVIRGWQNLGSRTKQLMFGTQMTKELDEFFLAAKTLSPAEGSATAGRLAAFLPFGFAGEFLRDLFTGHPVAAAVTATGYVTTEHLAPKIMARMLFTPGGARALTQTFRLSPGSPAFVEAARVVAARAALARQQEQQEDRGEP